MDNNSEKMDNGQEMGWQVGNPGRYRKEGPIDGYWHVYSDGKRADIPFLTDEDKQFARNSVAICAYQSGVTVLVVTVNDTHLHVLVFAQEERALRFRDRLRNRIIKYHKTNGHADRIGEGLFLACDPVPTWQKVKQKFMYVFRNCLDFFPGLPGDYPWGSGNIYFARSDRERGKRLGAYSYREQIRILHTNTLLPQDWRIDEYGSVLPASFVDYQHVEKLFVSARAFIAFLFVKREDEEEMTRETNRSYLEYRKMEELRGAGNILSLRYCSHSLRSAPIEIRLKVASRMIRRGMAGKSESLAKALYLKKDDLDRLL